MVTHNDCQCPLLGWSLIFVKYCSSQGCMLSVAKQPGPSLRRIVFAGVSLVLLCSLMNCYFHLDSSPLATQNPLRLVS